MSENDVLLGEKKLDSFNSIKNLEILQLYVMTKSTVTQIITDQGTHACMLSRFSRV